MKRLPAHSLAAMAAAAILVWSSTICGAQSVTGPISPVPRPAAPELGGSRSTPNWPPSGPAPRTADGKPDLSGAWEPHAFQQNLNIAYGGVAVPFQPWALKVFQERGETFGKDDPE